MFKQVHRCGRAALLLLSMALPTVVLAEVECTRADRSTWMDESDYREHMKDQGVQITKFVITPGNCYEIYGFDKTGEKVEIYSNPVDASEVAQIKPQTVAKP
ncbi:MAG: PepSY domain-containing protein [Pseudomonas sp.]|jgi:hypothetical protein|uniref:PepSY domain-containing protein n=1 Tax=Pseudomonas sp. Ga0074129 TaxID=1752219 RepID=UPI000B1D7697|nr:PepSY domain-containing protein [Pseudomonas sp. Ga0074129]MBA4290043.1 PepSY domain-containing protein [Pseudomonas sp.]